MSGHISRELRSTNKKVKKSSKTKNTERTRKIKKPKKAHKTRNTEIETERVSQDLVQDSLQTSTSGNSNLVSNTERSILGERDANEPQALVDNVEQENILVNNVEQESSLENFSNETNSKQSFIWNYLEKLPPTEKYKKRVKCLVKISGQFCGHIMGSDGSTGNFIYHLAKHSITRDGDLSQQNNENIEETQNNSAKKNRLDKKFVGIIIKDDQPISIRNDEGFREFVEELDPLYELPSDKKVRDLLVKSYNFCKEEIVHLFEQGIVSCSLTLDLWTSRSRAGYLGVTCSFVNSQFELCEATLAIKYLKYPHTSENIVDCLNQIIGKWKLDGKIFTITTDNGSNMVKAGKLLKDSNNITRLPCAAHTLQLVVGKGLIPAEKLVARAKRLISFFTTPKQTERLIEIQQNMRRNQEEVNLIKKFFKSIFEISDL
jgi:hypothetical protein